MTGRFGSTRSSAFATDGTGHPANDGAALNARFRVRADANTPDIEDGWVFIGALATDLVDGTVRGTTGAHEGDLLPDRDSDTLTLQEAWLHLRHGKLFGLRAGAMTSQWGLGLVANDGSSGLSVSRNDWFSQANSGDRVWRALVHAMPWAGSESPLRGLFLTLAADRLVEDDVADSERGQKAEQVVVAARYFLAKTQSVGLYGVARRQRHDDGKRLDVKVVDAAFDFDWRDAAQGGFRLEGETAYISGDTTLGPTPDHPVHAIAQGAAIGRLSWQAPAQRWSAQLDAGWFRGDDTPDDATLTAFRADRNLRQGMVLFERVLAWQTGRARLSASNPNLIGVPPEDADRLASGGAIFNAITVFPKIGFRPKPDFEVYGGLLLALAPSAPVDPFRTRTEGGGSARNFLGGTPEGSMLGTEIDLGVRFTRTLPRGGAALQLGVEHGILLPGGALSASASTAGVGLPTVHATRLTLSLLGK